MTNHRNPKDIQPLGASSPNGSGLIEKSLKQVIFILERIINPINKGAHSISKIVLFLLMFLTFFDIAGRNLLSKPITGTFELTGLSLVIIIFLSLGMTQSHKGHITIEFFVEKMPKKVQEVLNVIINFVIVIFLIVTSWQLSIYTKRVYIGTEVSTDLRLPIYYFTIIATVGMIVFTLSIVLDLFKSLLKVVGKDES